MAKKLTQSVVLDEILPSLNDISTIVYPSSVPISFHMTVAENINLIQPILKVFNEVREKILKDLAEKDDKGNPKIKKDDNGKQVYDLSAENTILWTKKLAELKQKEVKINLKQIEKKYLEGVEGLSPVIIKGLLPILK